MCIDEISNELKVAFFEFFFWFSRFEFVLKENGFLKNEDVGSNAQPSWEKFRERFRTEYVVTLEAKRLIELHPKRQIVKDNMELDWQPVGIEHCNNDLCRVIAMLLTIRNNLFHGGKYRDTDVDSMDRNLELLATGKVVLDQLANQFNFENDYTRRYY